MAQKSIDQVDKNFHVETTLGEKDLVWRDVRQEPFQGYGFYGFRDEPSFRRMPKEVASQVSESVNWLCTHTAGGRVRFVTDSRCVAIHVEMPGVLRFPHMPLSGTSGFDLYIEEEDTCSYWATLMPPVEMEKGYDSIAYFPDRRRRTILIHFPLYNSVDSVAIGLQEGASLEAPTPYPLSEPVVYYGSSITQGGCASRPGNCYTAILSRQLQCDYINLGFSGSAMGEPAMADYLAALPMSVFVCDYDHNAPDAQHLEETLPAIFHTFRKSQAVTPVIFVSKPDFDSDPYHNSQRREIIRGVYEKARRQGDRHVYFVDGETLFQTCYRDCCTVDRTHPNDLGFVRMAETIGPVLCQALAEREGIFGN